MKSWWVPAIQKNRGTGVMIVASEGRRASTWLHTAWGQPLILFGRDMKTGKYELGNWCSLCTELIRMPEEVTEACFTVASGVLSVGRFDLLLSRV